MSRAFDFAALPGDLRHDDLPEDAVAEAFASAFVAQDGLAQLSIHDAPVAAEMPDPDVVRHALDLVIGTLFDCLRDTRLEEFAADLSWGFVNSFHKTAQRVADREDDAARKLGDLARHFDPSEGHALELEETQRICRTLMDCRGALEAMRDHAGELFRCETGRPFSTTRGSRVSSGFTASQIDARDFLAARAARRREAHAPTGPVVLFSGGMAWHDHKLLWAALDAVHARIPALVLATTGQHRGCDQIAHAWAASRGITIVRFGLDRALGKRAGFVRNEQMMALRPVHAIVCEGSGLQANLLQRLRAARVPHEAFVAADQRPGQ